MLFYESKVPKRTEDWVPDVSSPEELLSWMDRIEYGWVDNDGGKHYSFDDSGKNDWYKRARIISPEELSRVKVGTCYEQTLFIRAVFRILWPEVETKMIHIRRYEHNSHAFLLFKKGGNWWHFEHAFGVFRGIHGPHRTVEKAVKAVEDMMEKFEPGKKEFEWRIMDPKDFRGSMSAKQFYNAIDYKWDHDKKR